ncbi:unnamed protein product [Paramecium sonneborni]|uniref:Uncharacterized protein n=1 Tax=Paramecium sonneborni TaxID=65129 RepID=A0A8S1PWM4_9CILI|nr:unnamed protein product [Paramecium sonneborni]CAD8107432.1 unnamed protein product [Paramecium sonneborni]
MPIALYIKKKIDNVVCMSIKKIEEYFDCFNQIIKRDVEIDGRQNIQEGKSVESSKFSLLGFIW